MRGKIGEQILGKYVNKCSLILLLVTNKRMIYSKNELYLSYLFVILS